MNDLKKNNKKIDVCIKIVCYLFSIACFFAYVFPVGFGSDTQPWALVFACVVIFLCLVKNRSVENQSVLLYWIIFAIYVTVIAFVSFLCNGSIRSILPSYANYLTVLLVPMATVMSLIVLEGKNEIISKIAINVWLLVGLVQKFIIPEFAYFILANHRTSVERGVISLAPEPSYYGFVCMFFLLISLNYKRNKAFYIGNLLFQIFFLAQSTITVVYLMIFIGFYIAISFIKLKKSGVIITISILLTLGILYVFILPNIFIEGRIGELINMMFYNPMEILEDRSFIQRLEAIIFSLNGVVDGLWLPHGYSQRRIMSGYGALLYECGLPGIAVIICQLILVYRGNNRNIAGAISIGLAIILISAVPLSTPMLSYYLGCCYNRMSINTIQE